MAILCMGLNHTTAPVGIREKLALAGASLEEAMRWLRGQPGIGEALVISTCNRVEFYLTTPDGAEVARRTIRRMYREIFSLGEDAWEDCMFRHEQEDAITHLFRVVSGMDSMVVGETQIAGQVKEAYRLAVRNETVGPYLNSLMHRSFAAAKRVRTETELGHRAVSVSSVAVELARKIFGDLRERRVLLAGAGEMAGLTARHLAKQGVEDLLVVSRTLERARALASSVGGRALALDRMPEALPSIDILICSTASPTYLLEEGKMREVMRLRRKRPVFAIDISVPRNIDPAVGDLENVYLYDMDDLQNVLRANLAERGKELEKAEAIIRREVRRFLDRMNGRDLVPTIVSLRARAENIRKKEVDKALSLLEHTTTERQKQTIEALSRAIVNKLLHVPIAQLKKAGQEGDAEQLVPNVHRLFSLNG